MGRYRIELTCTHRDWWRYNVVMTAEGRDDRGERCGYYAAEDRMAEPGGGPDKPATDSPANRRTVLECGPCASLQLYLYIIPHRLPEESDTRETPALPARLKITRDGKNLHTERLAVNAWGGYSGFFEWKEQE